MTNQEMPKINLADMPEDQKKGFYSATITALDVFFSNPENKAAFEKWLAERKGEVA